MAGFRGVLYTLAKLMGDYNAVKRQGTQTSGLPGGRKGHRQGDAEVVQVEGFYGEAGILRLLNCQLPL